MGGWGRRGGEGLSQTNTQAADNSAVKHHVPSKIQVQHTYASSVQSNQQLKVMQLILLSNRA